MKTPMTTRGAELLREELHRLKTVERPANSQAIGEARAHGDLSENAEYHAARERAGLHRGPHRRARGEARQRPGHRPEAGRRRGPLRVRRHRRRRGRRAATPSTWQIVGEDEADIKAGRISISSPIARALIGKESGESVEVQTPGGVKRYEIIDVRYE